MAKGRKPHGGGGGVDNSIPAPTGLIANITPENTVNIQWNPVPGATTYWVRRDNFSSAIVIIPGTNYNDPSVKPNTTYTYAIAAVVNSTLGPDSNRVSITTN